MDTFKFPGNLRSGTGNSLIFAYPGTTMVRKHYLLKNACRFRMLLHAEFVQWSDNRLLHGVYLIFTKQVQNTAFILFYSLASKPLCF